MARNRSSYTLLYRYISKEFAQNFAVSFSFFFCIFFINSILLLVQRILLRNIDIGTMLEIVSLSMPQFLIYTFPFASLSASSMVLGDLGSTNELLAMRSSGIPSSKVYQPLIIISLLLSLVTFFFADAVLPWSSVKYQEKLSEIMRDMPTFEIQPNSVNTIGSIVLSNGESAGNQIDDILLLSNDPSIHQNRIVTSPRGTLTLVDDDSYIYSLELEAPEMLITDPSDREMYGFTHADKAIFYLDFSSQIPALTSNAPMNLSSRDLISGIMERAERTREDEVYWNESREGAMLDFARALKDGERGRLSAADTAAAASDALSRYQLYGDRKPVNFFSQYYKAELAKKFVLSAACFCLTLVTLPLSMVRVKHGKLTGFAISLLIAVAYWYMLFGVQLQIFSISTDPYLLIALPDIIIAAIAVMLIMRYRKAR